MKKVSLIISAAVMILMMVTACEKDDTGEETKSNETTNFNEVAINNQVWMTENLNVDKFRNGDPIPHAVTDEEWKRAGENGEPAWCYYDNDPANGEKYGKLYNWYAVNDPRGLAPVGWKIPSDEDWTTLTDFLGGEEIAGKKMKSTRGWGQEGNGTNESGFSGLPGGYRFNDGPFISVVRGGSWWSSTENNPSDAWDRYLSYDNSGVVRYDGDKELGLSVRCLRD